MDGRLKRYISVAFFGDRVWVDMSFGFLCTFEVGGLGRRKGWIIEGRLRGWGGEGQ